MRYRKFGRRPKFRRMFRRLRRPAEVSNYAHATTLTATAGENPFISPAVYVTSVMSLASLVTDSDVNDVNTRSIPPQYKGVSIAGGVLQVCFAQLVSPYANVIEQDLADAWSAGYSSLTWQLYTDEFTWSGGLEVPDMSVVHPWQDDIIPGGIHTEFDRAKRVLRRSHTIMPGAFTISTDGYTGMAMGPVQRWTKSVSLRIPKCRLDERSALWLAFSLTNPWIAGEGHRDVIVGIRVIGPVVYRLLTS